MLRWSVIAVSTLVLGIQHVMATGQQDAKCMAWAIQRIAGVADVPATVPPAQNVTDVSAVSGRGAPHHRGPFKPGKRGPVGLSGPQGPPGPPGVCDCIPEEMVSLQKQYEDLEEKVTRIRQTSPEIFCLLGMKNRAIPDSAINVSSNDGYKTYGRLDSQSNGWFPNYNRPGHEWIMVDLGSIRRVTGVVTQGRPSSSYWVTKFQVEHSQDGGNFTDVIKADKSEMVFTGNTDRNTKLINRFPSAVYTRYVRIYPMSYNGRMEIRFDVIDC